MLRSGIAASYNSSIISFFPFFFFFLWKLYLVFHGGCTNFIATNSIGFFSTPLWHLLFVDLSMIAILTKVR